MDLGVPTWEGGFNGTGAARKVHLLCDLSLIFVIIGTGVKLDGGRGNAHDADLEHVNKKIKLSVGVSARSVTQLQCFHMGRGKNQYGRRVGAFSSPFQPLQECSNPSSMESFSTLIIAAAASIKPFSFLFYVVVVVIPESFNDLRTPSVIHTHVRLDLNSTLLEQQQGACGFCIYSVHHDSFRLCVLRWDMRWGDLLVESSLLLEFQIKSNQIKSKRLRNFLFWSGKLKYLLFRTFPELYLSRGTPAKKYS